MTLDMSQITSLTELLFCVVDDPEFDSLIINVVTHRRDHALLQRGRELLLPEAHHDGPGCEVPGIPEQDGNPTPRLSSISDNKR